MDAFYIIHKDTMALFPLLYDCPLILLYTLYKKKNYVIMHLFGLVASCEWNEP